MEAEKTQVAVVWKIEFSPSLKAHTDMQTRHSSSKKHRTGRIFFTSVRLWVSFFSSIYFFSRKALFSAKTITNSSTRFIHCNCVRRRGDRVTNWPTAPSCNSAWKLVRSAKRVNKCETKKVFFCCLKLPKRKQLFQTLTHIAHVRTVF